MEIKITKKEEREATKIKEEFIEVHGQISQIQEEMETLNQKSESLIKKLESLREEESKFIDSLGKKYGEGILDPFQMTYRTKENEVST